MKSPKSSETSSLRTIALLLVPRLASPEANRYALSLLGRLACCDTGLRDLAREALASRLVSQAADTAENAPKLERAFIDALVRHHECGEGVIPSHRTLGCIEAFVRRAIDEKIRRAPVAPQLMSASPYADALLALPRVVEAATWSVAERCYDGLGPLGGEPALDGSFGDHAHTLDEIGDENGDTLAYVLCNGWWDEEDPRQFDVPGDVGTECHKFDAVWYSGSYPLKADDKALLRTLRQLNPMADWNGGSHDEDEEDEEDEDDDGM